MHIAPDEMPLRWPDGWERTPAGERFRMSYDPRLGHRITHSQRLAYLAALGRLEVQMGRLSYGGAGEPGVACYFDIFGNSCVVACDQHEFTFSNFQRIVEVLNFFGDLRSSGQVVTLRRTIMGLRLAAHTPSWCSFFGFDAIPPQTELERVYKRMALKRHPDRGGTTEAMVGLNEQIALARKYYEI